MLIQKYNLDWPLWFDQISEVLFKALKGLDISIEHIGSTAVPGLAAKAIIDIDIVYPENVDFEAVKSGLAIIGYYHNGDQGIPSREAFKRIENTQHEILDSIRHHLYVCPIDSEELERHLLFRNYLRQNEVTRMDYEKIKFQIAETTNQDKAAYSLLKETAARPFILSVLEKARLKNH